MEKKVLQVPGGTMLDRNDLDTLKQFPHCYEPRRIGVELNRLSEKPNASSFFSVQDPHFPADNARSRS